MSLPDETAEQTQAYRDVGVAVLNLMGDYIAKLPNDEDFDNWIEALQVLRRCHQTIEETA